MKVGLVLLLVGTCIEGKKYFHGSLGLKIAKSVSFFKGVPPRLFSVNVDTDPSMEAKRLREAGFPMADALGIHKRGLSQSPPEMSESAVSLRIRMHCALLSTSLCHAGITISLDMGIDGSYMEYLRWFGCLEKFIDKCI